MTDSMITEDELRDALTALGYVGDSHLARKIMSHAAMSHAAKNVKGTRFTEEELSRAARDLNCSAKLPDWILQARKNRAYDLLVEEARREEEKM